MTIFDITFEQLKALELQGLPLKTVKKCCESGFALGYTNGRYKNIYHYCHKVPDNVTDVWSFEITDFNTLSRDQLHRLARNSEKRTNKLEWLQKYLRGEVFGVFDEAIFYDLPVDERSYYIKKIQKLQKSAERAEKTMNELSLKNKKIIEENESLKSQLNEIQILLYKKQSAYKKAVIALNNFLHEDSWLAFGEDSIQAPEGIA